jgi:NSS family neurotransmitter:Na+ symporter
MLISLFTGWYLDKKIIWDEVTNEGKLKFYGFKFYIFLLRFVAPVAIAIIFLKELEVI